MTAPPLNSWNYILDLVTGVDDEAAWMWRLKVCKRIIAGQIPVSAFRGFTVWSDVPKFGVYR